MTDAPTHSPTEYSDEEVLEAFDQDTPTEAAASRLPDEEIESLGPNESTSRIIAKRLGCTIKLANRRLAELADTDDVELLTPEFGMVARNGGTSKELIVRRIPEDGGPMYNLEARLLGEIEEERP